MLVELVGSGRVGFSGSPVGFGFHLWYCYFGWIHQDLAGSVEIWLDHDKISLDLVESRLDLDEISSDLIGFQ